MVPRLKMRPGVLKAVLGCVAGAIVFVAMPFLAFGIITQRESIRTYTVNGSSVRVVTDNWGTLSVFVVWVTMAILAIALYVIVRVLKDKPPLKSVETIALSFLASVSVFMLFILVITTALASLDLVSKCLMVAGNMLSIVGLAVSYRFLRQVPILSEMPG